jgi:hypothetical protein
MKLRYNIKKRQMIKRTYLTDRNNLKLTHEIFRKIPGGNKGIYGKEKNL